MSTYILMRILESAPDRYDLGIRLLTLGRVDRAYDRLASHVKNGQRVLDLGCGTGALTFRALRRGARVKGIDINPQMLEIAIKRARKESVVDSVELLEMGVAELDGENAATYDVVMSGLCFSELSEDEFAYALEQVIRILKPGGLLLVADEVRPGGLLRRMVHALTRAPLALLTYMITQQTTHPVVDLQRKIARAGLSIVSVRSSALQSFVEIVAMKSSGAPG